MSLFLTPRQFSQRAEFYHQLAQLTASGIPLPTGLEHLCQHPPARSYVQPTTSLLEHLRQGSTFSESLRAQGNWLPEFDVALLQAGEQSGRLDSSFRLLGDYYTDKARLTLQDLGDLAYPGFLLHFATFI